MVYWIFWKVQLGNHVIILNTLPGTSREAVKRQAKPYLGSYPDRYIVEPITEEGNTVKLDITVQV
jgi:hypothetical protein